MSGIPTPAQRTTPAETTVRYQEQRLTGRTGALHLHRWSPAGTPTVLLVLLHGLGEHAGQYTPLGTAAAAAGIETWAPDQAGHGRSDGVRVLVRSVDDLVADAEEVLAEARRTRPGTPVVVVGHSLGATVAALLVGEVRHTGRDDPAADVAGLVLSGSALDGAGITLPPEVDPWQLRKDPGELVRDPEQAARVRADPLVWAGGLRPETLAALGAAGTRTRTVVADGALDHLPVLLLHGGADDLAPAEGAVEVAERLARGRIVVFPEDRHNVLHEVDRAIVHTELLRFALAVSNAAPAGPVRPAGPAGGAPTTAPIGDPV